MAQQSLSQTLKIQQRMALLGRLRMAELIEMPEGDFAREVEKIEKDPLFCKLYFAGRENPGVIRRQRWPRGRLSGGFYELNERTAAASERVKVEELLEEKRRLLPKIRKMGQEAFERYFLYGTEPASLEEIAARTRLSLAEVRAIHDFILEIGAQTEFAGPAPEATAKAQNCLARVSLEDGEPVFDFFSPYWARGLYQIRYDLLEDWKTDGRLAPAEVKRLPHLLKRMETANLRQNTLFRILESLTKLQAKFLTTRREDLKRPISLRNLAYRLDLAPSTVSRAASGRSLKLPWGDEAPLIALLPGRRNVLRQVLGRWLAQEPRDTDAKLAQRLNKEYGIRVSRRTVNAVRNEVENKPPG
ncbi:MAG: hypothetical protein HY921_03970 [Elusimicrobia bacterium]|nr:hypothetical protein [Elusimicrobiota bacterium]